jgi:hypothetical protein
MVRNKPEAVGGVPELESIHFAIRGLEVIGVPDDSNVAPSLCHLGAISHTRSAVMMTERPHRSRQIANRSVGS